MPQCALTIISRNIFDHKTALSRLNQLLLSSDCHTKEFQNRSIQNGIDEPNTTAKTTAGYALRRNNRIHASLFAQTMRALVTIFLEISIQFRAEKEEAFFVEKLEHSNSHGNLYEFFLGILETLAWLEAKES